MLQLFTILFLFSFTTFARSSEEADLQQACAKSEELACEKLTSYYIGTANWDNAILLGDALCKKDVMNGCTYAGTAYIAKGKNKEGLALLMKSCDGFEPYACRSLGRVMKQNREELLGYMYSKRACYYGLTESCKDLKKPRQTYGPKGIEFLKEIASFCEDSTSTSCKSRLNTLQNCSKILTAEDCLLIPGELSIFFRAKLIQEGAKLLLMNIAAFEKLIKENSKNKRYSYDLKLLLKDHNPLSSNHYVFGFMKACTKKYEKDPKAESTSLPLYKDSYVKLSSRTKKNISAFFFNGKQNDCYDPAMGFEAFAVANLDPLNPARLDIWKISMDGNISHLQDGLPLP